jgi:hypothetical protein
MSDSTNDTKSAADASRAADCEDCDLKAKIGAALACFKCSHTVREPVWINKDGLFCCDLCKDDGEEGLIRVAAIEKLVRESGLPNACKHEGCEYKAVIDDLVEHEKECGFREVECLVCGEFSGSIAHLVDHLKEEHEFTPENPKWIIIHVRIHSFTSVKGK